MLPKLVASPAHVTKPVQVVDDRGQAGQHQRINGRGRPRKNALISHRAEWQCCDPPVEHRLDRIDRRVQRDRGDRRIASM
jgi:hypothetical protein